MIRIQYAGCAEAHPAYFFYFETKSFSARYIPLERLMEATVRFCSVRAFSDTVTETMSPVFKSDTLIVFCWGKPFFKRHEAKIRFSQFCVFCDFDGSGVCYLGLARMRIAVGERRDFHGERIAVDCGNFSSV